MDRAALTLDAIAPCCGRTETVMDPADARTTVSAISGFGRESAPVDTPRSWRSHNGNPMSVWSLGPLAVLLLLSACDSSSGDPPLSMSQEQKATLDATIETFMVDHHLPGAIVGVWMPGGDAYVAARGQANLESGSPPADRRQVRYGQRYQVVRGYGGAAAG